MVDEDSVSRLTRRKFMRMAGAGAIGSALIGACSDDGEEQVAAQANLAHLLINGVHNVKAYGAVGDGATDDTTAFQATIDAMTRNSPAQMYIPAGEYVISDELDLTAATEGVSIIGAGMRHSRLLVTPFGSLKKVLKFGNPDTNTRTNENNYLADFEIASSGLTTNAQHPIGIYIPYATGDYLRNIRVRALGNTAFWISGANNVRLDHCWASGGGHSYTVADDASINATFSGTQGSTRVTASSPVFTSGQVGKNFYVHGAGYSGFVAAHTITSVASNGMSATLDRAIARTFTNRLGSFEAVRGSISTASRIFTSDTGIFSSDDVGRYIYIEGAGLQGGILATTISEVIDPQSVEVSNTSIAGVSNAFFYLTPGFFIGSITDDDDEVRRTNDIRLSNCLVEGYQGCDYLFRRVTNAWGAGCKSHGIYEVSRSGRNVRNIIVDQSTQFSWTAGEFDFGHCKDGGNILICGGISIPHFDNLHVSAVPENQAFFDLKSSDDDTLLSLGTIHYNKDPAREPPIVKLTSPMTGENVRISGHVLARSRTMSHQAMWLSNLQVKE